MEHAIHVSIPVHVDPECSSSNNSGALLDDQNKEENGDATDSIPATNQSSSSTAFSPSAGLFFSTILLHHHSHQHLLHWSLRNASNSGTANDDNQRHNSNSSTPTRRHQTDFEVLKLLGKGAFGAVYQVRNKLDACLYAMKCVPLVNKNKNHGKNDDDMVYLREVQVLSSIQHENCVRYYAAWMEQGNGSNMDNSNHFLLEGLEDDVDTSITGNHWTSSYLSESEETKDDDDHACADDPVCQLCQSSYRDWEVGFEQWGLIDAVLQPLELCTSCYLASLPDTVDRAEINIHIRQTTKPKNTSTAVTSRNTRYLFILMEYCHVTLIEAVAEAKDNEEQIWEYFRQCLKGLEYLHDVAGIIHRDLKPSNILVRNGVVKVGDLGLATVTTISTTATAKNSSTAAAASSNLKDVDQPGSRSSCVGTFLYTAPEVASGKYDKQCDIFSLGIMLVEMFSQFDTAMERTVVLGNLHAGALSSEWMKEYPRQAELAMRMIAADPKMRPSCRRILKELSARNDSQTCSAIMQQETPAGERSNDILRSRIQHLEGELANREQSLSQLRQLLDEHGISHSHIK